MNEHPRLSLLLVTVQVGALLALAATGPLLAPPGLLLAIELCGIALGLWAIAAVRLRDLRIRPEVRSERLVTHGPYRWIRHPMYTALLLLTLPLIIAAPTLPRCVIEALLLLDLVLKLRYEERLLHAHFSNYAAYARRTWRVIPGLY